MGYNSVVVVVVVVFIGYVRVGEVRDGMLLFM